MPAITGLIVDREAYTPGPGFFKLYGKSADDPDVFSWWQGQVQARKEFDWSPYIGATPTQGETPGGDADSSMSALA
jgi:hypothetical protein